MLKSLFDFSKKQSFEWPQITPEEEPVLFDFIYRLADEAGAPRPEKVYLTPEVNASVFYELSLINLFFPSKKNLNIGVGLINVLSIGEFKAVLAHEFGHFVQKSMLLGRYVYMAQQIAARVVNKRDALDTFLSGLSRVDIRIAWIGWILSVLVWAVRALVESLFTLVSMAERALSREMEFQADLVAASLTGSDALIFALHKLRAADEGYRAALASMSFSLNDKKYPRDLYALQTNFIERMRLILDDERYGITPKERGATARVFDNIEINPPEMWSTHPADNDREANVKRYYLEAEIDERSSWLLFSDPKATRVKATRRLLVDDIKELEIIEDQEAIASMNESEFDWEFLNSRYHGLFHNRFSFCQVDSHTEMLSTDGTHLSRNECYPESSKDLLEEFKRVLTDKALLTAVKNDVRTAEKRQIVYRGDRIKRSQVKDILLRLEAEEISLRQKLVTHDVVCRSYHQSVAKTLGEDIARYHAQLCHAVHYAEHTICDLMDVEVKFNNTISVAMADGRVSDSELNEILRIGNELHSRMNLCYMKRAEITHGEVFKARFKGKEYQMLFEEFTLPTAGQDNISDWAQVVGTWTAMFVQALTELRLNALEELLLLEEEVEAAKQSGRVYSRPIGDITMPETYHRLKPGEERELQMKLGLWDRFHQGDGIVPSIAKFAVAASMVGATLFVGDVSESGALVIHNGLSIPVLVEHEDVVYSLTPFESEKTAIELEEGDVFVVRDFNRRIVDRAVVDITVEQANYVYNVASAALLYQYDATYGAGTGSTPVVLGVPRFLKTTQAYVLEEPPYSLSTTGSSASRSVLGADSDVDFSTLSSYVEDERAVNNFVMAHAMWDKERGAYLLDFLMASAQLDSTLAAVRHRLSIDPWEVSANRVLMDHLFGKEKEQLRQSYERAAAADPSDARIYYLLKRINEENIRPLAEIEKGDWEDEPWINYGLAYTMAEEGQYGKSTDYAYSAMVDHEGILSYYGTHAARCYRMAKAKGEKIVLPYETLPSNRVVAYYELIEQNHPSLDGTGKASYHLSVGNLDTAIGFAESESESTGVDMLWLVAASDGCSKSHIARMIERSTEGLQYHSWLAAIALKIRERRPIDVEFEQINSFGFDTELTARHIDFVQSLEKGDLKLTETMVESFDNPFIKPYLASAARIVYRDNTPDEWVMMVDAMLFPVEKPWFEDMDS